MIRCGLLPTKWRNCFNRTNLPFHVSGELLADSVVAFFTTTAADNKKYQVAYYNLDMIISVGYRVNSHRGVQFRILATQVLREYLIKGFAMNDELLERGKRCNVDRDKCISCMRCVAVCPHKGRKVSPVILFAANLMLKKACSIRKENELFFY